MKIDLELRYPLHLRRYGDGRVVIVDMAWVEVAEATSYDQVYEIVRLANAAYELVSDLERKIPHANTPSTIDGPGRPEVGSGIPDAQSHGTGYGH